MATTTNTTLDAALHDQVSGMEGDLTRETTPKWGFGSSFNILDENIVGYPGDRPPQHSDVLKVIHMLDDAGISCCLVAEHALIYYGTGRVSNDRELCVPDEQYDDAVALFKSHPEILAASNSLALPISGFLFRRAMPHISCEPSAIERSLGGLPYPNLKNFVEALLDAQDGADLEDLIDAQDISEEWGEAHNDLDLDIDIE